MCYDPLIDCDLEDKETLCSELDKVMWGISKVS